MKDFLVKWCVNIVTLFLVVRIISGISVDSYTTTIIAALVIGLLNAFLRPLLIMLTLPLTVFSLGLFTLVINGFIFYIAGKFIRGFTVANFWTAFWAALLFSIVSFLLNVLMNPRPHIHIHRYETGNPKDSRHKDAIDTEGKVEE